MQAGILVHRVPNPVNALKNIHYEETKGMTSNLASSKTSIKCVEACNNFKMQWCKHATKIEWFQMNPPVTVWKVRDEFIMRLIQFSLNNQTSFLLTLPHCDAKGWIMFCYFLFVLRFHLFYGRVGLYKPMNIETCSVLHSHFPPVNHWTHLILLSPSRSVEQATKWTLGQGL